MQTKVPLTMLSDGTSRFVKFEFNQDTLKISYHYYSNKHLSMYYFPGSWKT